MIFKYKDVISLDETLSPIILAGLKKFKEELIECKCGSYPAKMYELVGVGDMEPTIGQDEMAWQMWLEVIDKMIYAFDQDEQPNMDFYDFDFVMDSFPTEEGFTRMSIDVTNQAEYDRFREDENDWYEKCKEGRMLLSEYFDSLWL